MEWSFFYVIVSLLVFSLSLCLICLYIADDSFNKFIRTFLPFREIGKFVTYTVIAIMCGGLAVYIGVLGAKFSIWIRPFFFD